MFKNKYFLSFLAVFTILFSFFLFNYNSEVNAQEGEECDDKVHLRLVVRDDSGSYLGNLDYELYEREYDADGLERPGKKVKSGEIDPSLGYDDMSFTPDVEAYILMLYQENDEVGEMWFFDDFNFSCGEEKEVTVYVSGIHVILRDTQGNLLKNRDFSIYTQKYDFDGEPINSKNDLVDEYNTYNSGEAYVYLAGPNQYLPGVEGGSYVFVAEGEEGEIFTYYDIEIDDESMEEFEYAFSDVELIIEDSKGIPFPEGSEVELFEQEYDFDENEVLGDLLRTVETDDMGTVIFEYPAGTYAIRIAGEEEEYEIFWDVEIEDQERNSMTLRTGDNWSPPEGGCGANSKFEIVVKNIDEDPIIGINYELYEEVEDINGLKNPGSLALKGETNYLGEGENVFNPDPRKKYVLKLYDENSDVGDFWFYDDYQFVCDEDLSIVKRLTAINIIFRDFNDKLIKNQEFSIYTQKFDYDGNPIKEKDDYVGKFNTGEKGEKKVYVSYDHPYQNEKRGKYVLNVRGNNSLEFDRYDIDVREFYDTVFQYHFSEINFIMKGPKGTPIASYDIEVYEEKFDSAGNKILGKKLETLKTNENGLATFQAPFGNYSIVYEDDAGEDFIQTGLKIVDEERLEKEIVVNTARVRAFDENNNPLPEGVSIKVFNVFKDDDGNYYKNDSVKSYKITASGYVDIRLVPGVYLFTLKHGGEFGDIQRLYKGKLNEVNIKSTFDSMITDERKYRIGEFQSELTNRLLGRILLQVEEKGEAWYLDIDSKKRYYLKDGPVAYEAMRKFGLGITDADIEKIPVGFEDRFEDVDTDGDGLADKLEEAIGTDKFHEDTDRDGYTDGEEVRGGYDAFGPDKMIYDDALAEKLKGRILLQVESMGEAWYINPEDGKRYYMKDGESAYQIMRFLSLGITNSDLDEIIQGELEE